MAAEGDDIVWFIYTGEDGEDIPFDATHVIVHATIIPADGFLGHRNIVEVICHVDVEIIESRAFFLCPSLRRVIMPGVKVLEESAFYGCPELTDVECGKLEIIKEYAFEDCRSLRSINLPSAEIVEVCAFAGCKALTDVKFSSKLERIERRAFASCRCLERITVPLKDDIIADNRIFEGCRNLRHVDLVEGALLHVTVAALQLEDWRNDMNEVIDSINRLLRNAPAGSEWDDDGEIWDHDAGEKAQVIRRWIRSVLRKIIHYQVEHQRVLDEAASTLELLLLSQDIAMNNILPFVALPSHTFDNNG
eukprot:scaffold4599_cov138-Skeletonema_menzelii.AAC.2